MTKADLQNQLKESMLAKNELKTSVLRLLLSAINYYEIQKGGAGYVASEEDVASVIQKEAKQRRDSIEEFKKAGRQELVDKEEQELRLLGEYLPEQMSEDEMKTLVAAAISETGASTIADMGKVMGALGPKLKGKADMGIVSGIVKSKLTA